MQDFLHNWVYGVACAGCLCAVCMYLCPEGRVKNVLQMASACVMVLTLFAPLLKMDMAGYAEMLTEYREQAQEVSNISGETAERLNRMVIEQEYREYILDKADSQGIALTDASVGVTWNEGGYWVPCEAEYVCGSGAVTQAFLEEVEKELGIPKERQNVCETNE